MARTDLLDVYRCSNCPTKTFRVKAGTLPEYCAYCRSATQYLRETEATYHGKKVTVTCEGTIEEEPQPVRNRA